MEGSSVRHQAAAPGPTRADRRWLPSSVAVEKQPATVLMWAPAMACGTQ